MKKLLSTFLAILMAVSVFACGKQTTPKTDTQKKPSESKIESENNAPKEPKNYTLVCIPSNFMDDSTQDGNEYPESLVDNVTIRYQHKDTVLTSFGTTSEYGNTAVESAKKLTIDGKTYDYTLQASTKNEWSKSESPLSQKYAFHDTYMSNNPKTELMINSTTKKISFYFDYDAERGKDGDIGEDAIAQRADQLLVELYGEEYLNDYTRSVSVHEPSQNDRKYYVMYMKCFGAYLSDDWVRFTFNPKGELISINARSLDLLKDFDFTEDELNDAKKAMYSSVYSDPAKWPTQSDIGLVVDGLTGTCYMETYVFSYNGQEVEWRLLLALN